MSTAALNVARKYGVDTNPTPQQLDAGNFKKKHIVFQGIPISIENPKGTIRRGINNDGKPWANRMAADYGYIKRTTDKDGDQVDVFVGPNKTSDKVFIVDQLHHHMKKFDEHKCLLGFSTRKQALTAYHNSYGRVYGAHHTVGGVTEMSVDAFKEWLKGSKVKREPVAPDVPKYQTGGAVKPTSKITRNAFLYMEPKPPKDSFAQCGTCLMFTGTGCVIMGKTNITKDMTCGLYVRGNPQFHMKGREQSLVSPEEAGLINSQVRCENCRYGANTCALFKALNDKMPNVFDLDIKINPKGCCNAFVKGT